MTKVEYFLAGERVYTQAQFDERWDENAKGHEKFLREIEGAIIKAGGTCIADETTTCDEEYVLTGITDLGEQLAELQARLAGYEWIPVSERLPEEYRDEETRELIPFLVCEVNGGYPFRAVYDGVNWGDGMFKAAVTHWMPLPEAPKGGEA